MRFIPSSELINFFDFANPSLVYRLKHGGGEAIAKAIKINNKSTDPIQIIDATCGFGIDSLILAKLNYKIYAIERNLIMAKLLQDGLIKAKNNNFLAPIVKNITLLIGDSRKIIPELVQKNQYSPDIIYLDPMFPTKKKSAAPNKRIQTLQHIINSSSKTDEQPENENIELLKISLIHAKSRVVVKRPRISANLGNIKPNFSLIGKANRFDIYLPREFEKLRIAFI